MTTTTLPLTNQYRVWLGCRWDAWMFDLPTDDPEWRESFQSMRLEQDINLGDDDSVPIGAVLDSMRFPRTQAEIAFDRMMGDHYKAIEICHSRGIDPYLMTDSTDPDSALPF